MRYEEGDLVRHTGRFLRSIGWVLDVPINGYVHGVTAHPAGWTLLDVEWSDGRRMQVIDRNVEPDPRAIRMGHEALGTVVERDGQLIRNMKGLI